MEMSVKIGIPIKFIGVGERLQALEVFHPDRMASRILGMGDVLGLIEKAEQTAQTRPDFPAQTSPVGKGPRLLRWKVGR